MNMSRQTAVLAHDDGVDRWKMIEGKPDRRLAGRIRSYVSYEEQISSFTARRELASTSGVLIYALGEPLEIVGADGQRIVVKAGEAFAGGIADGTSLSRGPGFQRGVHIHMPLASLAAVTGAPLATLANRVAPLVDLVGLAAADLGAALCEAQGAEARFALLDRFLSSRLAVPPTPDRTVAWAMAKLDKAGAPHSTVLAAEIGWSRKHFARRFRDYTGLTPDRYRRLVRFERFTAALARCPDEGLAGLAVDAGYFDQAHLTHEVFAFAAMTPDELRARLVPEEGGVRHD